MEEIVIMLTKEEKEKLDEYATEHKKSVNCVVLDCLMCVINRWD